MTRTVRRRHWERHAYPQECLYTYRTVLDAQQAANLFTTPQIIVPVPASPEYTQMLLRIWMELVVTQAYAGGVTYNARYRPNSPVALLTNFTLQETQASTKQALMTANNGSTFFSQSPPMPAGRAIELYTTADLSQQGGGGSVSGARVRAVYVTIER